LEEKIRELRDGQVEVNVVSRWAPHCHPDAGLGEMKGTLRAIENFSIACPPIHELVNCHDVRAARWSTTILVCTIAVKSCTDPQSMMHRRLEDVSKKSFLRSFAVLIHRTI
jgi:hypothetical protein